MRSILLILMLACAPAFADSEARLGNDTVRTYSSACMHPVVLAYIARMVPQTEFRKAYAVVGGKRYEGCWRPVEGGIHLIYEDGDQGLLPDSAMKPVPEA
jgi:hypothetical protein